MSPLTADSSTLGKMLRHFSYAEYLRLLRSNRNYRLYLLSHVCQHAGDWFVHVASLIAVERIAPDSGTAVSLLVMSKTIPDTFLTPVGGMLADTYDRRKLMIAFDLSASLVVLGYLLAIRLESLELFLTVNATRSVIHALYEPVTRSIVPLLVPDMSDLKRAVTLHACVWSGMMVVGGVVGGYGTAYLGLQLCYVIDSMSYLISSFVMRSVTGSYVVSETSTVVENEVDAELSRSIVGDETTTTTASENVDRRTFAQRTRARLRPATIVAPARFLVRMTRDLLRYLTVCGFGTLAFMKATGTTSWGVADVVNVSLSHVDGDEARSSERLGKLFSCYGVGCLLGPLLVNPFVDVRRPSGLQAACVASFAILAVGWYGISQVSTTSNFPLVCFFTTVRALGGSVVWVDSTLLLQMLSSKDMLGRVLGFEYSAAQFCEAIVSLLAGRLEDNGFTNHDIAFFSAANSTMFLIIWSVYHLYGGGAASARFNADKEVPKQAALTVEML